MKRTIALGILLLATLLTISGCNTVRGMGQDIEQGGEAGDMIKRARDLMGAELGKRARAGEDDAKRHLNNRYDNQTDKYGKKTPLKTTPIKKTLSQKIMRMLKGKMK